MVRQKTLLVLAAGRLQVPAIEAGRRLGLRVVAADGAPDAPGLALADAARVIDIGDPAECLALARAERVDGVIHPCSEVSMAALGLINREMGLHGPDPETATRATNKEAMRRAFERAGAPSPRSFPAHAEREALEAAAAIGGPIIVKPSRNSGSRGVGFLPAPRSEGEILEAYLRARDQSRDRSALVEEYVEGPEFSVEALVWDGRIEILAITDKVTSGPPHFVEVAHSQPTRLGAADAAAVRAAGVAGIRALGLDWCAAHVELKLAARGPILIEIGARLGGDWITTELVPRSTGIDMVGGAIRLALGEEPDLRPAHPPRGAAIRYLTPAPGVIARVTGVDEARAMVGVQIVDIHVVPGDRIGTLDSSLARAGHVIAEGTDAGEALERATRAAAAVVFDGGEA